MITNFITIDYFRNTFGYNAIDNGKITDDKILFWIRQASVQTNLLTHSAIRDLIDKQLLIVNENENIKTNPNITNPTQKKDLDDKSEIIRQVTAMWVKFGIDTGWDFISGTFSYSLGGSALNEALDMPTSVNALATQTRALLNDYNFTTSVNSANLQVKKRHGGWDNRGLNPDKFGCEDIKIGNYSLCWLWGLFRDPKFIKGDDYIEVVPDTDNPANGIQIKWKGGDMFSCDTLNTCQAFINKLNRDFTNWDKTLQLPTPTQLFPNKTANDWLQVGDLATLIDPYASAKSILRAGENIKLTPNDTDKTITIDSMGGGGGDTIWGITNDTVSLLNPNDNTNIDIGKVPIKAGRLGISTLDLWNTTAVGVKTDEYANILSYGARWYHLTKDKIWMEWQYNNSQQDPAFIFRRIDDQTIYASFNSVAGTFRYKNQELDDRYLQKVNNYWTANQSGQLFVDTTTLPEFSKVVFENGANLVPVVGKDADQDNEFLTLGQFKANNFDAGFTLDTATKKYTVKAGYSLSGDAGMYNITSAPTSANQAANKQYVDVQVYGRPKAGLININSNNFKLFNGQFQSTAPGSYRTSWISGSWKINSGTAQSPVYSTSPFTAQFDRIDIANQLMYHFIISTNEISWQPSGQDIITNIIKIEFVATVDISSPDMSNPTIDSASLVITMLNGTQNIYTQNDDIMGFWLQDTNPINAIGVIQ